MRVALFITCVNDALFPGTGRATVALLERLGVEVDFPAGQTCCGQMHYNTGYRRLTEPLLYRTAEAFTGYDHVVTPSGSCAAMVREHYPRIGAKAAEEGRGTKLADAAASLAPRVYELTEFLIDILGVVDVGAYFPHTVTYHPSCHGLRTLGLGDRPTRLLQAVEGLQLRELPEAEECCGFGGTFAIKNPDVSAAMATDKIHNATTTGAEILCATDNSCLMHLGTTLTRNHTPLHVMHLAEILAHTHKNPTHPTPPTTTRSTT
jgi:L-lactate dehydrogenase complex protein LldE